MGIFIDKNSSTFEMTKIGLLMFVPSYLFMGFNMFFSAMFTTLSNGKVSALLSLARSIVFIVFFLLTLPHFLEIYGVWLAVPLAEALSILLGIYAFKRYKPVYGY